MKSGENEESLMSTEHHPLRLTKPIKSSISVSTFMTIERGTTMATGQVWPESQLCPLKRPDNLVHILAGILEQRGHDTRISGEAFDQSNILGDYLALVHASPESIEILNRLWNTPELRALHAATFPYGIVSEPDVTHCNWDDPTKTRVRALYWEQRALNLQSLQMRKSLRGSRDYSTDIQVAMAEAKGLLKENGFGRLHLGDISALIEQVVDRELVSTQKQDQFVNMTAENPIHTAVPPETHSAVGLQEGPPADGEFVPSPNFKLWARLLGVSWVVMGAWIGYVGTEYFIRLIQADRPVEQKVGGVVASLILVLLGGGVIADGVSDIISGKHHSLSHPLWSKVREKWVSKRSSLNG